MVELFNMELAKARQRVNRAELALERAEEMLDEDCGVGINIALCSRIRAAQRQVIEARERLTKIDPPIMVRASDPTNYPGYQAHRCCGRENRASADQVGRSRRS